MNSTIISNPLIFRNLIINVLDDENGVTWKAYNDIEIACDEMGWYDIIDAAKAQDNRYYIQEDDAKMLRETSDEVTVS